MERDLQIIGDRIEFMGYHVGNLCDLVPSTIRDKFEQRLTPREIFNPLEFHAAQTKPRKARK